MTPNPIDSLLASPAFDRADETPAFRPAVAACLAMLRERFPRYAEFLDRGNGSADLLAVPPLFLPVLKGYQFASLPGVAVAVKLTSSGTTGRPSETPLDEPSWRWRVRAMRASYEAYGLFTGEREVLAFLMDPATTRMAGSLVIDAVLREVPGIRSVSYLARLGPTGPEFDPQKAIAALTRAAASGPLVLVGYPALIAAAIRELAAAGRPAFPLPEGSGILTGGGWKSFQPGLTLDRDEFRGHVAGFFRVPPAAVRDMFGLSECPAVFIQCEHGSYHIPAWTLARSIDPETGRDVSTGEVGLLQLLVPLTISYPLLSILTTDKVTLHDGCPCGRRAPHLVPRGRVTAARFETCAMAINRAVS